MDQRLDASFLHNRMAANAPGEHQETENIRMKAALLGLCFLIATATSAVAAQQPPTTPAAPPTKAEQELLDLSRTKWRWMSEKKADTLATLFHDKSVFVHMGGAWGKDREVEIIRSGGIHYKQADILEASARIMDSTAIVLSRIRLLAVVGGNEVTNPFMVTEVFVRQNGAWKLGSLSFTRLMGQ
jgi:Domain of unknown function (DUF4440)